MIDPLVTIIRLEDNFRFGMFGILLIQTEIFCWTLEPPEYGNVKRVSCIPAGCYECQRIVSQRFATTFEVKNVPGRSSILFHRGNTVDHTEGCILLGGEIGVLKDNRAVLSSGQTFNSWLDIMGRYKQFSLIIKESWV